MRLTPLFKMAMGTGAALLVFTVAPATMASASPATFVPCSSGGAGLVAAVTAANVAGGTINLAPGCTYSLTSSNNGSSGPMGLPGFNGLPQITNTITINGFGATISANNTTFRIFQVNGPSGNLTLQGLTLTGGNAVAGGAILNAEGAVTLNGSRVTGNTAQMGGGAIASGVVNPNDLGPIGTLTLNASQVNGNTSVGGGGGGILNHAGTATLKFSQVDDNTSTNGGGIASGNGIGGAPGTGSATLNVFASQVDNNTASAGLGGPGAGGIANGSNATITLSQVNGNTAPGGIGGGIFNHGTMTINFSSVSNNTAPSDTQNPPDQGIGGGIGNGDLGVPNSGVLTINVSQVNNNSASGPGGGIAEFGEGAEGLVPGNTLALNLSLVAGNTAAGGGGGIFAIPGSPVTLKLTAIIKNHPDNCEPLGSITGCFG